MDKHILKDKIGKDTYEKLEKIVLLANKKKLTKEEFGLAYQGLYERAMKHSNSDDQITSTLGYIYLNVMRHYQ